MGLTWRDLRRRGRFAIRGEGGLTFSLFLVGGEVFAEVMLAVDEGVCFVGVDVGDGGGFFGLGGLEVVGGCGEGS